MIFRNRHEAGLMLADALRRYRGGNAVVIGLPRGGLPVALPVAEALHAPLDVLVAKKIGAPDYEEFAIAAVSAGGALVYNDDALRQVPLPGGYIDALAPERQRQAQAREAFFRAGRPPVPLAGRTAIIVDDGVATGMTVLAAIEDVRARQPLKVVVAAPVIGPEAHALLSAHADEVVAVQVPARLRAVGQFYTDFTQTTDEEALACLQHGSHLAAS